MLRTADTLQFMKELRLTLQRLEVGIVFLLNPHRIRLIKTTFVGEMEIEHILRMRLTDRQRKTRCLDTFVQEDRIFALLGL